MENSILFVQDSSSFLINAIITQLTKENVKCECVAFDLDVISQHIGDFTYIFLTVDKDTAFKHMADMTYIKDNLPSTDARLMLMGSPNDIEECVAILSDNNVQEKFVRPINTRDVVDRIMSAFFANDLLAERKNILVVDDSGTFLHTVRDWLEPTYKVIMVNSATSAISYLASNKPDLILLDYEMPVCSGPKLLELIRSDADNASIPVMFLTGKGDRESVKKVLDLKPQGYLLKSLPRAKVLEALKNFFDSIDQ